MNDNIIKVNCKADQISKKLKRWINAFIAEAELFEKANNWTEFWRVYKEEPLLSLLATGIARSDSEGKISVLREYPVYSNGSYVGRSDLFLNYYEEGIHFFIEAKYERARWETGFLEWSDENRASFIKEVNTQLSTYVEAEKSSEAESYSVILLFYVLDFKHEVDFRRYKNIVENCELPNNQLLAFVPAKNPTDSPYQKFGVIEIAGVIEKC